MTELREWPLQGRPEILSGCGTWAAREKLRIWGPELALLGHCPPCAVRDQQLQALSTQLSSASTRTCLKCRHVPKGMTYSVHAQWPCTGSPECPWAVE